MKYLVIGGTGTLGTEMIKNLLLDPKSEVVCFSRDELKQKGLASQFKGAKNLSFIVGDIRDRDRISDACVGVNVVFHFAALKHVDTGEEFPEEFVKTDILGTINVADACTKNKVKYCVFSSTDKAVDPINVYGMCKGISEKILFRRNQTQRVTRFSVFRWGNVLGSRGSVIPVFRDALISGQPIPITHPEMSRFWIKIEKAVQFVLLNYKTASLYSAIIPPIGSCTVIRMVAAIADHLKIKEYRYKHVGIRPGEKLHEVLISSHLPTPLCSEENSMTDREISLLVSTSIQGQA